MKRFSHFIDFTTEEFAADESFQRYVFRRDDADIAFWTEFAAMHPEKVREIRQATELLTALNFKSSRVKRQTRQAELNRLFASIASQGSTPQPAPKKKRFRFLTLFKGNISQVAVYRVAASFAAAVTILCFGFFLSDSLLSDNTVAFETKYGETATYTLPDSSVIILNGNSRLKYRSGWNHTTPREVWLEGEAFFEVKHKGPSVNARFIVHIPGMEVEVLGTKFNVLSRNDKANVVLNSGKVKVKIHSDTDTTTVVMVPDEEVALSRKDLSVKKSRVKAEMLTSWRNQVLVFEQTPLSTVAEMIEETYGVKVIFENNVDASEKLQGTVPSENLDLLLSVLAKSSNLHITNKEGVITIGKQD